MGAGKGLSERWEVRVLGFLLGFQRHGSQWMLEKEWGLEHAWMHIQQSIGDGIIIGDLLVYWRPIVPYGEYPLALSVLFG